MDFAQYWFQEGPGGDTPESVGQSLRFRGNSALHRDLGGDTISGNYTVSFWMKPGNSNKRGSLFSFGNNYGLGGTGPTIDHDLPNEDGQLRIYPISASSGADESTGVYRDFSAWYHIMYVNETGVGTKVFVNGQEVINTSTVTAAPGNTTMAIGNIANTAATSLRFEGYMADWYFIDGQVLLPTAFGRYNDEGVWVPREVIFADAFGNWNWSDGLTATNGVNNPENAFDGSTSTQADADVGAGSNTLTWTPPTAINWTTSVEVFTTSGNVGDNTQEIRINGNLTGTCGANAWTEVATGGGTINTFSITNTASGPGRLSGIRIDGKIYVDGTNPSYGTNGFHLDFSDPADIGADSSGNGNDFTPTGFELADQTSVNWDHMADSPSQNYSTINPISFFEGGRADIERANLSIESSSDGSWHVDQTQISQEHFYFEMTLTAAATAGANSGTNVGITRDFINSGPTRVRWSTSDVLSVFGTETSNWAGTTWGAAGDVLGCEYDRANTQVRFFLNGTLAGTVTDAGLVDGNFVPLIQNASSSGSSFLAFNFGQQPWLHAPAGVTPETHGLQTQNLPAAPIANGRDHFQAITDTGANILTAAQATFPNGFWWIKDRVNSNQHQLVNSVNGTGNVSQSPSTVNAAYVAPAGNSVAWCWNAPDAFSFDGSGGINGLIPVVGFRDQAAGFSILNYTCNNLSSQNIAHGLTAPPELIIWKDVDRSASFVVWHTDFAITEMIQLNTNNGVFTGQKPLNARPNEFLVFLGDDQNSNANGETLCMYSWHSVPGYSAIGIYTGNGSNDGPFIYTGFRPAFVLIKNATKGGPGYHWQIQDTTRCSTNPNLFTLSADLTNQEAQNDNLDFLSNGFKLRTNAGAVNGTGDTMIYLAFAENPFGGSNVSPANAR